MPRKAKSADITTTPAEVKTPKKRGRKPSTKKAEVTETSIIVEEPLPGQLAIDETVEAPVAETPVAEAPVAEVVTDAIAEETVAADAPADAPVKKTRKPRAKKADYKADKKAEPVLITTLQIGSAEFDISNIAERAYKAYKSTHKRKVVTEFRVYVKPEENAAYYTVNGEGSADFKIDL